ncbi:MAG TPA: ABC transporter ATP-binding protein [Ignavibacteria bacterium]|nr:ABC transporter ATP-binding protein [Ignavibacteria bacterium]
MPVISTKNLRKEYQSKSFSKEKIVALKDFSFEVNSGEIIGLLGPNGAGKTTLIKILLGIVFATDGEAKVFDQPISKEDYKKKVGYLPENHKYPNYLKGGQVLEYFGRLSGLDENTIKAKSREYLALFGIEKWDKTSIKKYSKGMMQRLGLAQSMMNDPELLFLDEPTDGVDPVGRKHIRDVLLHYKSRGKTIFINSHLLSEVELICDRVAILNKGELIRQGTIDEITNTGNNYKFITSDLSDELSNSLLMQYKAALRGKTEFMYSTESVEELNKLIDLLRSKGILIHNISLERNSLENMFINLVGEEQNQI